MRTALGTHKPGRGDTVQDISGNIRSDTIDEPKKSRAVSTDIAALGSEQPVAGEVQTGDREREQYRYTGGQKSVVRYRYSAVIRKALRRARDIREYRYHRFAVLIRRHKAAVRTP